LRHIGFDPGLVDGMVGPRTKAAYIRLHTACSEGVPLVEDVNLPVAEGRRSVGKPTNRDETQKIQLQLRRAGFDPGPADGIFGSRTQSALSQFKSACLMAKDFEGMLDDSLLPVVTETGGARMAEASISSSRSDSGDGTNQSKVIQAVRAREEIRILQLRLRDEGFDPGPFDGVMGPKTRSALAQYEASQGGKKIKPGLTTSGGLQY
jgi:peptidoglycan hydrolase-like protein with peptidoglycan-binding domain